MLIQDQFGYFYDVPDERFAGWVNPGFGEVVYDGLGNPLGFPLLSLLPLAAQILPSLLGPSGSPSSPPAPAAPPPPPLLRHHRRRFSFSPVSEYGSATNDCDARTGARRGPVAAPLAACSVPSPAPFKVAKDTGRVDTLPSSQWRPSPFPEPVSMATEASGEMNGWYSGPYFGGYY